MINIDHVLQHKLSQRFPVIDSQSSNRFPLLKSHIFFPGYLKLMEPLHFFRKSIKSWTDLTKLFMFTITVFRYTKLWKVPNIDKVPSLSKGLGYYSYTNATEYFGTSSPSRKFLCVNRLIALKKEVDNSRNYSTPWAFFLWLIRS